MTGGSHRVASVRSLDVVAEADQDVPMEGAGAASPMSGVCMAATPSGCELHNISSVAVGMFGIGACQAFGPTALCYEHDGIGVLMTCRVDQKELKASEVYQSLTLPLNQP